MGKGRSIARCFCLRIGVWVGQAERENPLRVGWQLAAGWSARDRVGYSVVLIEQPGNGVAGRIEVDRVVGSVAQEKEAQESRWQ